MQSRVFSRFDILQRKIFEYTESSEMQQGTLVVIVVIVIIVILLFVLATPSCRNFVSGTHSKESKKVSKSHQSVELEQASREEAARKIREAHKPTKSEPQKNIFPAKPILSHATPGTNPRKVTQEKDQVQAQPDLSIPERVPVLKGRLENLFDFVPNAAAEFGLTDEQVDRMARDYHAKHLADKKPQQIRNRNIIRRDAELADQKLRSSFVSMAANKTQRGSEFVNEAMQKKIMSGKTESRKETRQIFKVPNNR